MNTCGRTKTFQPAGNFVRFYLKLPLRAVYVRGINDSVHYSQICCLLPLPWQTTVLLIRNKQTTPTSLILKRWSLIWYDSFFDYRGLTRSTHFCWYPHEVKCSQPKLMVDMEILLGIQLWHKTNSPCYLFEIVLLPVFERTIDEGSTHLSTMVLSYVCFTWRSPFR